MIQTSKQNKLKIYQVERPENQGRQAVEIEDKKCTSCNWDIRNNKKGSEPSVAPRSPFGHRATEGHTNEHSTHHSVSVWVNRFDLLLRSGLCIRPPTNN
jgi:hypothetical protein